MAARSSAVMPCACPRPRSAPDRRYPARTRRVCSPIGFGWPTSRARNATAAIATLAVAGERPPSKSTPRYSARLVSEIGRSPCHPSTRASADRYAAAVFGLIDASASVRAVARAVTKSAASASTSRSRPGPVCCRARRHRCPVPSAGTGLSIVPKHRRLLRRFHQCLRCPLVGPAGLARRRRVQLLSVQDFSHGQDLDARMLAPR